MASWVDLYRVASSCTTLPPQVPILVRCNEQRNCKQASELAITDETSILQLQLLLLVFPAGSQALVGVGWQAKRQQWQMMMMMMIMVLLVIVVMIMMLIVMIIMVMMQMTPAAVASNQAAVAVAAHRLHLSEPKYRHWGLKHHPSHMWRG